MPVNEKQTSGEVLYQRDQYSKGGIGKIYWDYRDKALLSLLEGTEQKLLDVGCGEGITLQKAKAMLPEADVIGIDFMAENVEICAKHGLQAVQGDVYKLDFPDNSVDAVLFIEVIEHLLNPEMALKEIYRVLKPGGRVVVMFPNDKFFRFARILTLKFQEAAYDPGHVRQWTHADMRNVLEELDFEVFSHRSIPFIFWPISLHGVVGARKKAN